MSREVQRIHLRRGLSIYREGRMWLADIMRGDRRMRLAVDTDDVAKAVLRAEAFAREEWGEPGPDELQTIDTQPTGAPAWISTNIPDGWKHLYGPKPGVLAPVTSVAVAMEKWKEILTGRGVSEAYLSNLLSRLNEFFTRSKIVLLQEATSSHVSAYLEYLRTEGKKPKKGETRGRPLAPKSVCNYYDFLIEFWTWVAGKKWIAESPCADIAIPDPGRKKPTFFRAEQVEKIEANVSKDPVLAALVAVAIYVGPRREEIWAMKWEDVDWEARIIRGLYDNKRDGFRDPTLLDQVVEKLEPIKKESGRIFARWEDIDSMGKIVTRRVKRSLGTKKNDGERDDGLQIMRHTAVTWWQANGVSAKVAADWAGHTVQVQQDSYTGRIPTGARPLKMTCWELPLVPSGLPQRPQSMGEVPVKRT